MLLPNGATAATFDPATRYAGQMTLHATSMSVEGDDVFVVYSRALGGLPDELVVLRLDAANEFRQVRRIAGVPRSLGYSSLPLSDGTVFVMEPDPATVFDYQIRRYAPNGTNSVVWREAETTFGVHGNRQMLVGPLRP